MAVLRYGNDSSVELTLAAGVIPSEVGIARGEPLADLRQATLAVLANPLDYPPLAQCIMPADRVVLALDHGTPQLAQMTASVIQTLLDSGVEPESISVLPSPADRDVRNGSPCRLLAAPLRERIAVLTHDPTDRRQLAYLAANALGDAILINRALHEADVVISIGCLRADETAGYFGIHGAIFPACSDFKTIQRFRSHESSSGQGNHHRDLIAEADHVAWLLGVNFTIQVVPGADDQVLHVLAGQSQAVERRGRELYRGVWSWPVTDRASLVVAGMEGDATQQTWENFGRTLQAAARFAEEDGAIVICSDLSAHPGAALRRAAHAHSAECECSSRHAEHPRGGGGPAAQLARVLQGHKVYLLSQLDPSVVEELDVIPIAKPDELNRLARQHGSCIVLSNAPYVTTIT